MTFADDDRNAVVRTVAPGSPAEQAGLKPGDVIETLQGIAIDSPQDVLDIVAKMRPGTMLDIGVSRRVNMHAQAPLAILPGGTVEASAIRPIHRVAVTMLRRILRTSCFPCHGMFKGMHLKPSLSRIATRQPNDRARLRRASVEATTRIAISRTIIAGFYEDGGARIAGNR